MPKNKKKDNSAINDLRVLASVLIKITTKAIAVIHVTTANR